jgi:hypothetical protein
VSEQKIIIIKSHFYGKWTLPLNSTPFEVWEKVLKIQKTSKKKR